MAEVLRFRPVLFGPPERPTDVLYVLEESDGQAFFRGLEFSWPLQVSLDAVTVADLPAPYHGRSPGKAFHVTVLPAQEVRGRTPADAFDQMLTVLQHVRARGAAARQRTA